MTIIQIKSIDPKWEQTDDNYVGKLLDGEKQTFKLLPYHPTHKSLFEVTANIYITNPDTDFILDIKIGSIVQFDTDNDPPTTYDLFEAYCKAREDWNNIILKESINRNILIQRQTLATPYEILEPLLTECINITYP